MTEVEFLSIQLKLYSQSESDAWADGYRLSGFCSHSDKGEYLLLPEVHLDPSFVVSIVMSHGICREAWFPCSLGFPMSFDGRKEL